MDKTCHNCGTPITKAYCEGYPEVCEYWKPRKPPTNADRIRAMSDEELADYFSELSCFPGANRDICKGVANCMDCWLDWLRQEATND